MNARQDSRSTNTYLLYNQDRLQDHLQKHHEVPPVSFDVKDAGAEPVKKLTSRGLVLRTAESLVDGDRNVEYGDPNEDFRRTSVYWSTHVGGVLRRRIANADLPLEYATTEALLKMVDSLLDPHDVAIMMIQLKNSRLAWSPSTQDHWVDSAGYAACGYDCVAGESL